MFVVIDGILLYFMNTLDFIFVYGIIKTGKQITELEALKQREPTRLILF